nr:MAG TPA: Replication initiation and membrane attachment [Caudoviricetes sp.]
MATGKRYYWMKLKESFMTSDTIDYFMSQDGGANYVVLYQMLCLKTINTAGRLSRQIGEIIIPYDIPKIQRDLKWFSTDTIRVALELYKSFGLIYEDIDGVLTLTDHAALVGSETDWAAKKQRQRLGHGGDIVPTNVPQNVPTDIDIRDITTTTTNNISITHAREEIPSFADVHDYFKHQSCLDQKCSAARETARFITYNAARGWDCLPRWREAADLWVERIGDESRH